MSQLTEQEKSATLNKATRAAHAAAIKVLNDAGIGGNSEEVLFSCIVSSEKAGHTATMLSGSYVTATRAYINLMYDVAERNLGGDFYKLLGLESGIGKADSETILQLMEMTSSIVGFAKQIKEMTERTRFDA